MSKEYDLLERNVNFVYSNLKNSKYRIKKLQYYLLHCIFSSYYQTYNFSKLLRKSMEKFHYVTKGFGASDAHKKLFQFMQLLQNHVLIFKTSVYLL